MKLTDAEFESMKTRLNAAIHEIVIACQFAEQDDLDDACTSLATAQGTIEEVADELVRKEQG